MIVVQTLAPLFYGIALPLDDLLVVRAFELWVHHEDPRRATGRASAAPDDTVLRRMTELSVALMSVALARAGLVGQAGTSASSWC